MQFKVIQEITGNIINTIQNVGIASVNAIKAHTFGVTVKNFPKNQTVSGTVTVANQKNVEKKLSDSHLTQKSVLGWLKAFKLPTSINVGNFPKAPEFPKFPEGFKISNFPKQLPFPKNIRITNQPTAEIKKLNTEMKSLKKAVKAIKLDPKINVTPPVSEKIVVPAPSVTLTQDKFDYKKLSSLMPKPAKELDYKKLSESIASEIAQSIVTVGGGGSSGGNGFINRDGTPGKALVDSKHRVITNPDYFIADKETTAADVIYTGNENSWGDWFMMRVDGDQIRYASSSNNTGYPDYANAWDNRVGLEYDYPSNVDF